MLNALIIITANDLFLLLPAIGAVWFLRLPRPVRKEMGVISRSAHWAVLWLLALLVGAGRITSGLHSPTDVIGSFVLAICAGFAADRVARRIFRRA